MSFILAKKLKMTSIFTEEGTAVPVTVLEAGPCKVTQVRNTEKDGYNAIQIGFGVRKQLKKPQQGHLKDLGNYRYLQEFRVEGETEQKRGDEITVEGFKAGEKIHVTGVSKGRGFSGVIRRHNFSRGPETHGSRHHREPGSIGSAFPEHVIKGRKLPGQHGNARVTVQNLKIVEIDPENNLLVVEGAVPGHIGSLLRVQSSSVETVEAKKE